MSFNNQLYIVPQKLLKNTEVSRYTVNLKHLFTVLALREIMISKFKILG